MARLQVGRTPWDDPRSPPNAADLLPSAVGLGIVHESLLSGNGDIMELYNKATFARVPTTSTEVLEQWPQINTDFKAVGTDLCQLLSCHTLRGWQDSTDTRQWTRPLLIPAKTTPGFKDPLATASEWTRQARKAKAKAATFTAAMDEGDDTSPPTTEGPGAASEAQTTATAAAARATATVPPAAQAPAAPNAAAASAATLRAATGELEMPGAATLDMLGFGKKKAERAVAAAILQEVPRTGAPGRPADALAVSTQPNGHQAGTEAPGRPPADASTASVGPHTNGHQVPAASAAPATQENPAATAAAAAPRLEPIALGLASTVGLLFPDQGSYSAGMIASYRSNSKTQEYNAAAKKILGYDLLEKCEKDPEAVLEETGVCQQLAMYIAGLASFEKLRETRPQAAKNIGAVAGLDSGEYAALYIAGVFSFEDGLQLVKVRGEAMAKAAKLKPQSTLAVAGLQLDVVADLCQQQRGAGEVCEVANMFYAKGFYCAGTQKAIEKLKVAVGKAGAKQAEMLKAFGGFHTELMLPAQEQLEAKLKEVLPRMLPPRCDVYMNSIGQRVAKGTPPVEIQQLLSIQLCAPVLWETEMKHMIQDGLTDFYEVGPGNQLKAVMKKIDAVAWKSTESIEA